MIFKKDLPIISVVMPVYNEAPFISDTLRQIIKQNYPEEKLEILVVDGMSTDGTNSIVEQLKIEYPRIKLFKNPMRISSAGRNIGFRNGRGDYFVIIDGHCYIPTTNLFRNIFEAFDSSGADCLGRPQRLDPPGLSFFQEAAALARGSKIGHSGASFIYSDFEGFISPTSNGAAYRRGVFDKVGYVDESFDAAEDVEFNYRVHKAGLRCYTSPKLLIKYYPRENARALFKQLIRYGRGRCRFVRKHPGALTINQLIPPIFVVGLLIVVACSAFVLAYPEGSHIMLLPGLVYVCYVFLILLNSFGICFQSGWRYLPVLPPIFFIIHFALGWGFLYELIMGRGR